jgi:TPR repeat protein
MPQKRSWPILIVSLCLALPASALADDTMDRAGLVLGTSAYEDGDYDAALRLLGPLAIPRARFYVSLIGMYLDALKSSTQGNHVEAAQTFCLVAQEGHPEAQFRCAFAYDVGEGVPQDAVKAVKWYRSSAEQGFAEAQFRIGAMFKEGRGVPQDYVLAHMWLNLAGAQSTPPPGSRQLRDHLATLMGPAEIAEAQKRAREWQP